MCIQEYLSAEMKVLKLQCIEAIKHKSVNSLGVSLIAITGVAGFVYGL